MSGTEFRVDVGTRAVLDSSGQIEWIFHEWAKSSEYIFCTSSLAKQFLIDHFQSDQPQCLIDWLGGLYFKLVHDNTKIAALLVALLKPVALLVKPHGKFLLFSNREYEVERVSEILSDRVCLLLPIPSPSKWQFEIETEFGNGWVTEYVQYFRDLHENINSRQWNWDDAYKNMEEDLIDLSGSSLLWTKAVQLWFNASAGSLCVESYGTLGMVDLSMETISTVGKGYLFWPRVKQECSKGLSQYIESAIDLHSWAKCNEQMNNKCLKWPFPEMERQYDS